jgi:hypothetical protein
MRRWWHVVLVGRNDRTAPIADFVVCARRRQDVKRSAVEMYRVRGERWAVLSVTRTSLRAMRPLFQEVATAYKVRG